MAFINIENKENSAEKLAAVAGKPTKYFLFAEELNLIAAKINELRDLISGGGDVLLSSGVTTVDGDEATFSVGFVARISGDNYENSVEIIRTLPLAAAGKYRTHVAYMDINNDILIAIGDEDDVITQEPDIPVNTVKVRTFLIFGDTVQNSIGPELPFNFSALDEWMSNPVAGNKMLINIAGVPYKIDFQKIIDVLGGSPVAPNRCVWNYAELFNTAVTGTTALVHVRTVELPKEFLNKGVVSLEVLASRNGSGGSTKAATVLAFNSSDSSLGENALAIRETAASSLSRNMSVQRNVLFDGIGYLITTPNLSGLDNQNGVNNYRSYYYAFSVKNNNFLRIYIKLEDPAEVAYLLGVNIQIFN